MRRSDAPLETTGVGARTGAQQPSLDPLPAVHDIGEVQLGPELAFSVIPGGAPRACAPSLGRRDGERPAHAGDFIIALHRACEFHQPLSLDQREPLSAQRVDTKRSARSTAERCGPVRRVDRRRRVFRRPSGGSPAERARRHRKTGEWMVTGLALRRSQAGWMVRQAILVRVFEQNGAALGGNEAVAAHAVQQPDRHVAAVRGVANVDRVEQSAAAQSFSLSSRCASIMAIGPQRRGRSGAAAVAVPPSGLP